jgi:hypothetical protein
VQLLLVAEFSEQPGVVVADGCGWGGGGRHRGSLC